MKKLGMVLLLGCMYSILSATDIQYNKTDDDAFVQSFIRHYDFHKQGRYTHEYHPFLLEKTVASMEKLEHRLASEGITIDGRIIIAGYEQEAIPSYYTDFRRPKISDEQSVTTDVGCCPPAHNRFGLMTGFLFKDINFFAREWYKNADSPIEHINPETIEIFQSQADLFARDALGDAYDLLCAKQVRVENLFFHGNVRGIIKELVDLWLYFYASELRAPGSQVIGTQDILFSVHYARYLQHCSMPVRKYYTGPDITYPIEVHLKHNAQVTRNAQELVSRLGPCLVPLHGQPTAYVFCSFVDGVGKSTMLGNIKNWMIHGKNINAYQHVDNSSSQRADVVTIAPHVVIADLPAQISHFTYKPDGLVYVCLEATLQDEQELTGIRDYVRIHKNECIDAYIQSAQEVRSLISKSTFNAPQLLDHTQPLYSFIRNLYLLKRIKTNCWIPCSYQNEQYIFNLQDISLIKKLMPIAHAPSDGLKNVDPTQMLFTKGVSFPLNYDLFLDDLIKQLHSHNVRHIVFVDFLSMYPRSCRENVRINYLVQQLALLDQHFDLDQSLYSNFLDDAHLYARLISSDYAFFSRNMEQEVILRLALYRFLSDHDSMDLATVSTPCLHESLLSLVQTMHQIPTR